MKKKIIFAAVAIILILGIIVGFNWLKQPVQEGNKDIEVTIIDETGEEAKEVLHETYHTDASTLTEFVQDTQELEAKTEQSDYGTLLTSIGGLTQDMSVGPWLVYDSNNNTVCQEAGMCPAMDEITLKDGDSFEFSLIASYE